jgi:hypothetical protein
MNNTNYIFLRLEERNGEYEYTHRCTLKIPDSQTETVEKFVKNYAKGFYGSKVEQEDDGYFFNNGEVFVRIREWEFISEGHFNILNRYL